LDTPAPAIDKQTDGKKNRQTDEKDRLIDSKKGR